MHKAIHHPKRIAAAQKTLLRRMRKELPVRLQNVTVGFQGGNNQLEVFANNAIWFAHQSQETERIPRNWNALATGMAGLARYISMTVKVNSA